MKLLLDSHLLIWMASESRKLSSLARTMIEDPTNEVFFSSASIRELMIKYGLGKITADPHILHEALLANGYQELPVHSLHALTLNSLPPIHKDPFDRILIAQSMQENMVLLTADSTVAQYGAPVRLL